MHKRITIIIETLINLSPYSDVECKVIPNRYGNDGGWEVMLTFKERGYHHHTLLIEAIRNIGSMFGEIINIQDKGNIVFIG